MDKTMTKDEALSAIGELKDYVLQLDKLVWAGHDIKAGVKYQHPHTNGPSTLIRTNANYGSSTFSRLSSQSVIWREARDLSPVAMAEYLNKKKCRKVA